MKLTILESESDISKTIGLKDEKLVKTANAQVYSGIARKNDLSWIELKDKLSNIENNECIILGVTDFKEKQLVVTPNSDEISRSLEYFRWSNDYQLICIDFDDSNLGYITPDELINILDQYLIGFKDIKKVIKYSTSAWIYSEGNLLSKSNGFHIYFLVNHPERIKEIFAGNDSILHKILFPRYGWIKNSKPKNPELTAITQMERTIYDNVVFSPERIIFESLPILNDGLEKRNTKAEFVDGSEYLDLSLIKELTISQTKYYNLAVDKAKLENTKSTNYIEHKQKFENRVISHIGTGAFKNKAEYNGLLETEIVSREWAGSVAGVLNLDSKVEFKDHSIATVRDILSDKKKYHLMSCYDPNEPQYSNSPIAIIYSEQETPVIKSFAHGGILYYLEPQVVVDNFDLPDYWLNHFYFDYHERNNNVLHISGNTIETMSKEGFVTRFSGYFNDESKSMTTWWINRKDKQTISGDGFFPSKPVVYKNQGRNMLNSYLPAVFKFNLPEPTKEIASQYAEPWVNHIKELVYNKEDAETIIDFFSYLIQEPDERPMWSPIICSETRGVGKDTIVDIFASVLGDKYIKRDTIEKLSDPSYWGDTFHESKLIVVSECGGSKDRFIINDSLKSAITETSKNLNLKGKSVTNSKVFCGIILFSNHNNPFKIDAGERRFFATKCNWTKHDVKRKEEVGYFRELRNYYQSEEHLNGLYHYLCTRDIKSNMKGLARETEVFRQIVEDSVSDVDRFFNDLKKHPCKYWKPDMIYKLHEIFYGDTIKHQKAIEYNIHKMKSTKVTMKIDGKNYRLKTFDADLASMDSKIIRDHIDLHWKIEKNTEELYHDTKQINVEEFSIKNEIDILMSANTTITGVESYFEPDFNNISDEEYFNYKMTDDDLADLVTFIDQHRERKTRKVDVAGWNI